MGIKRGRILSHSVRDFRDIPGRSPRYSLRKPVWFGFLRSVAVIDEECRENNVPTSGLVCGWVANWAVQTVWQRARDLT